MEHMSTYVVGMAKNRKDDKRILKIAQLGETTGKGSFRIDN